MAAFRGQLAGLGERLLGGRLAGQPSARLGGEDRASGRPRARPMRASSIVSPSASSCTHDAAPTTAMSISLRGMNRSYAEPLVLGRRREARASTSNSPRLSTFLPGAVQNSSTGTSRVPSGPAMTQTAFRAISGGIVSPAGDELQRFPPTLARLWICQPPTIRAASARAG